MSPAAAETDRRREAERQRGEISSYPGWSAGRLRVMVSDYLEILQGRLQTLGTEEEDHGIRDPSGQTPDSGNSRR